MELRLSGKRALVTGSSAGIGEGIARFLAAEGAAVVVHGRNAAAVERIVGEMRAEGHAAAGAAGDLADDAGARDVADAALSALGGIEILVNNAGIYDQLGWSGATPDRWLDLFNKNVVSMVRLIQRLGPGMREARWGRLIQIASVVASQPTAFEPHYAAAKAAVVGLTMSLAKEFAGTGVTANVISPGPVMTQTFANAWRQRAKDRGWAEDWETIEARITREVLPNTTGRVGRIEDVAALAALVASPLGGYINGANLAIDGGSLIGIA